MRLRPREFPASHPVRKVAGKGGVSVAAPPPDWPLEVELEGQSFRLARRRLELVDLVEGVDLVPGEDGKADRLVERRARVWRVALPPLLRTLTPAGAAGMLDYAEAMERVASGAGGSDPFGGGGSSGARSPSLAAVAAAERLRHMRAELARPPALVEVVRFRGARDRHVVGRWHVPLADLAFAAAVEGLTRRELARRIAGSDRAGTLESVTVGVAEAARRLACCCGYGETSVAKD